MRVLGIETSGLAGSVALLEDGAVVAERTFREGMRHGRDLVPTIREFLEARGRRIADLGLIAVGRGPGSYTGLRVGLACAKALAYASNVPLIGVNSLDVTVRNATDAKTGAAPDSQNRETGAAPVFFAAVILDARWNQVYARAYVRTAGGWDPATDTLVGAPERVRDRIPAGSLLLGDGAAKYPAVFAPPDFTVADPALAVPRAVVTARLGEADFRAGRRDDPMTLVPDYLRPTEAEVNWGLKPMPGI